MDRLPSFLNEYGEQTQLVYGLCCLHAMRNAGSKSLYGYAAVRNFARAASDIEREQKLKVTEKQHNTKNYVLDHEHEIYWLHMHKTRNLGCTFGTRDSNGSEQTNNHCFEIRSSLPTQAIDKT